MTKRDSYKLWGGYVAYQIKMLIAAYQLGLQFAGPAERTLCSYRRLWPSDG